MVDVDDGGDDSPSIGSKNDAKISDDYKYGNDIDGDISY
jgi:hypothetical protein